MVSDSKDINPRTVRAHNLSTGSVTTAKAGKKIIHTEAADPTAAADAGTGYEVGTLWNNTASGQVFVCTSSAEEFSVWRGQDGDDVNFSPAFQGLTYGYESGGSVPNNDKISRWPISAPHTPIADLGELSYPSYSQHEAISGSTMYIAGGRIGPSGNSTDDLHTMPTAAPPVSTTDVGEITTANMEGASGWSSTRGYIFAGRGHTMSPIEASNDTIQDYALSSPHSAADISETVQAAQSLSGCDNDSYTFILLGAIHPAYLDSIQTYEKGTGNNSTDVGEITHGPAFSGCSATDNTNGYGFVAGGGSPEKSEISRFAFASPYASADIGEVSVPFLAYGARRGVSSPTHGFVLGRTVGGSGGETLQSFPFSAPYPSTDVGEVANSPDYFVCHSV